MEKTNEIQVTPEEMELLKQIQEEKLEIVEEGESLSRRLGLAMNVDKINDMPYAAQHLAKFIKTLESVTGEIGLELSVTVNPFDPREEKERKIGFDTNKSCKSNEDNYLVSDVKVENEFDFDDGLDDDGYDDYGSLQGMNK